MPNVVATFEEKADHWNSVGHVEQDNAGCYHARRECQQNCQNAAERSGSLSGEETTREKMRTTTIKQRLEQCS